MGGEKLKDLIKKLKKFYQERRIFAILMIVCIVCLVIMVFALFKYFYFGSGKYSKRTCADIKTSLKTEIITELEQDPLITSATMRVSDKSNLIFVTINFNEAATLVEAESKAVIVAEKLSEKEKKCYDIQFSVIQKASESSDGFNVMGALNSNGTNISWNNNNIKDTTPSE